MPEPPRSPYDLKMEIDSAQQDLAQSLHALRDEITRRVDVRAKLDTQVAAARARALDAAVRGRELGLDLYARGRRLVRDRPAAVAGLVVGAIVLCGIVLTIRRELREPAPFLDGPRGSATTRGGTDRAVRCGP